MTRPRCLKPAQTYLITRRCSGRRFLLRPDSAINNLLLYLLAIAAQRYEIELHAFAFLSNHYHLVLSETSAEVRLPEFMGWFNQNIARLVNILRGRSENLWSPGSYNAVVLIGEEAVMDKIVYTICNPVAAGLVEDPEDWEGSLSLPWQIESSARRASRPDHCTEQRFEARASLTLTRPPCFRGRLSAERFRKQLTRRVRERLAAISEERRRSKRSACLGMEAVLEQDPEGQPAREEAAKSLKPMVACRDPHHLKSVLEVLSRFQASYRENFDLWRGGQRSRALFPAGTYGMQRFHNAACAPVDAHFALE